MIALADLGGPSPHDMVIKTGRQVSKSTTIAASALVLGQIYRDIHDKHVRRREIIREYMGQAHA